MEVGGHERGGVGPVLEHLAAVVEPAPERLLVVGTEAGEEGEEVGPGDDVDGVDLHGAQPVEHGLEVAVEAAVHTIPGLVEAILKLK